ncbi:unnamed protein product [Polarella glacialis]|uniref:Uncharacterized protein n=1 Tax=Polarella glacialis TaxID=89957 RepID=A0A813J0Y0_POLGL|nr:unnamed protein product [Polarella glacialis]
MASRQWVAGKLAAPMWQGGAGLGERCGLLGQLLSGEVVCSPRSQSDCEALNTVNASDLECGWDVARGTCGVPPSIAMQLLRRDYRDELGRVTLRRQRCSALRSQGDCTGSCQWDSAAASGACTLRQSEALLTVLDEDCPLRGILGQHSSCTEVTSNTTCGSKLRKDGLPECEWLGTACEASPSALEFDLLLIIGLAEPSVEKLTRTAHSMCSRLPISQCRIAGRVPAKQSF